ncbi:unnamed protein product [Sphagnum balticum]
MHEVMKECFRRAPGAVVPRRSSKAEIWSLDVDVFSFFPPSTLKLVQFEHSECSDCRGASQNWRGVLDLGCIPGCYGVSLRSLMGFLQLLQARVDIECSWLFVAHVQKSLRFRNVKSKFAISAKEVQIVQRRSIGGIFAQKKGGYVS